MLPGPIHSLADGQAAVCALAVLVAVLAIQVAGVAFQRAQRSREGQRVVLVILGIAGLAFLLRALASWGPADLAEPRRWDVLYAVQPERRGLFFGVPTLVELAHQFGVPGAWLYRWLGPLAGAMAAGATVALALAMAVPLRFSALAGILVAGWPAHIHHSASGGLTVLGGGMLAALLALAQGHWLAPWQRVTGTAALTAACLYVRPEYRVVLPAVALLATGPTWTPPQRVTWAAMTTVLLLGLAPVLVATGGRVVETSWIEHVHWLFGEPRVAPVWWCALGVVGLAVGHAPVRSRLALAWTVATLVAAYALTKEPNPGFGLWRYYLSFLPLLAVGCALCLARVTALAHGPAWTAAVVTASLAVYAPLWTQTTDLQHEFHTARVGAAEALRGADLMLVPDQRGDPHTGLDHAATALFAAHFATGWQFSRSARGTLTGGRLGPVAVASLEDWLDAPDRFPARRVAAWWGVALPRVSQQSLERLGTWRAVAARPAEVLLQLPTTNARCPPAVGLGLTLQPCTLDVGWRVLQR